MCLLVFEQGEKGVASALKGHRHFMFCPLGLPLSVVKPAQMCLDFFKKGVEGQECFEKSGKHSWTVLYSQMPFGWVFLSLPHAFLFQRFQSLPPGHCMLEANASVVAKMVRAAHSTLTSSREEKEAFFLLEHSQQKSSGMSLA